MRFAGSVGGRRVFGAVAVSLACLVLVASAGPAAAAQPLPPQGPAPAGTNDFDCVPDPRHPWPVVLVHGTFGNMAVSWGSIVPPLKRLGYCVFALDYGNSPIPGINGTGDIPTSAAQLKTFVQRVLAETGAARVSVVGHSQGGMMPRWFIRFLDGSAVVDEVVGLSPSSRGTTNPAALGVGPFCASCIQQAAGSQFMQTLNEGDETPGRADYTVIETRYDEVVTPPESEFLRPDGNRVTNVMLQDRCPGDLTEHVAIIFDPPAIQWMLNALGRPGPADPEFQPDCTGGGAALAAFPNSDSLGGPALALGGLKRKARATLDRQMSLTVVGVGELGEPVERVRVRILPGRDARRAVGYSGLTTVAGRRKVTVRLRAPLRKRNYIVSVAGFRTDTRLPVELAAKLRIR